MTPTKRDQARAERARLEAQRPHMRQAEAEATRARALLEDEVRALEKRQEQLRYTLITEGQSEAVEKELAQVDTRVLAAAPNERQQIDALLEATARAARRHAVEHELHLKAEMATFREDNLRRAADAETKLRAVATALREAKAAWEETAREWQVLAKPLAELLKEHDHEVGVRRDVTYYANAVRVPAFPVSPAALAAMCRPAAVALLAAPAKAAKPSVMRRIA